MKPDEDFTFGEKGPTGLGDFDTGKIEEKDMWESMVLSAVMHALFIIGMVIVGFLALITGRRDG